MTGQKDFFVQAAFYCTPIYARLLICPARASVEPPESASWQEVNDELMRSVPSTTLLQLVRLQLTRDLNDIALENINGWVLHGSRAKLARDSLKKAAEQFLSIRDGVFKTELTAAVKSLLVRKPQYRAALSTRKTLDAATRDIVIRALSVCRFHWEIGLYANADGRALAVRALALLQAALSERIAKENGERSLMMPARFRIYRHLKDCVAQFTGLDPRLDSAITRLSTAVALFPNDGRALYGSGLDQFWEICDDLIGSLNGYLEDDFGPGGDPFFDDFDDDFGPGDPVFDDLTGDFGDVFEHDTIDTLVELDQIDDDMFPFGFSSSLQKKPAYQAALARV